MSLHLLNILNAYIPESSLEREHCERMKVWAKTLPQPFSRHQPEAHFTGSALVVDSEGAHLALVHHAKLQRWLQPGGHAEPADDAQMELTALREAREETGCEVRFHAEAPKPFDLDIHVIPARKDEPEHFHLDVRFLLVANNPEALVHDAQESLGARWLTWKEAFDSIEEESLLRLLTKGQRWVERLP